jgi:LmbE family N-acetylglucosaminyl deacetylase
MKILAIGSHYDDIEIGCAGTIFKYFLKGNEVTFAVTHTDEFRTGPPDNRIIEQDNSLTVFGFPKDYKTLYLFAESDSDSEIIETLDKIQPDVIFAPFENDTHQHHRRTSVIAQAVGRKRHMTVFFYDSGSTYDFYPNVFSTILFSKKLEILNCFESQIKHGAINLDIVRKKNAYWGSLVSEWEGVYAEGFVARKMRLEI